MKLNQRVSKLTNAKNNSSNKLKLTPDIVIPVLISADSLVIEKLITKGCEYIRENLQDVISARSTHQSLKSSIIKILANIIPLDTLDTIRPANNLLIGRIYK